MFLKKVVSAQIGTVSEWLSVIKFAWLGLSLIVVSFVGIYIDIFVFKYIGVSLIWFPSFLLGMWFITRAEETFKASDTSN